VEALARAVNNEVIVLAIPLIVLHAMGALDLSAQAENHLKDTKMKKAKGKAKAEARTGAMMLCGCRRHRKVGESPGA
jgi:flagellar biosynthesis protein FlhB